MKSWSQQTHPRLFQHTLPAQAEQSPKMMAHWLSHLQNFFFCSIIRPWSHSLSHSFISEPRLFLIDWSSIQDHALRLKNFVASHLFKSIFFWNEFYNIQASLFYLQDTRHRIVDFLVTKQNRPWLLIHVDPDSTNRLNPALPYFHRVLQTTHALQLAPNIQHVDCDFRAIRVPKIFPLTSFLSQLV